MTTPIQIIPYSSELQPYFESISKEWVNSYFTLEAFDLDQLLYPEEKIISKGGAILFAKEGENIVGTIGLVKVDEEVYELVKMGVVPAAQGKNIGRQLILAIMEKARELNGKKLILFSSKKLEAALHLYQKVGFREVSTNGGKYDRCDVEMELYL